MSTEKKLFLWEDSALYIGDSLDPSPHSHLSVQCCIAIDQELEYSDNNNQWQKCQALLIDANVEHQIRTPDGPIFILYLEQQSEKFKTIISPDPNQMPSGAPEKFNLDFSANTKQLLIQALNEPLSPDQANTTKQTLISSLSGRISRNQPIDERVQTIIHFLKNNPSVNTEGAKLASLVDLSESRLQHLFKAQMGVPIRRYVLWMRLRLVSNEVLAGSSLTEAAHTAGFSDSAHFSRTFKSMFGITPSDLVKTREQIQFHTFD